MIATAPASATIPLRHHLFPPYQPPNPPLTLNVTVVYESFRNGQKALEVMHRAASQVSRAIVFKLLAWDFASLHPQSVVEPDITPADGADLLLVATSGDRELPPHVRRWIERCLADNPNCPAFITGIQDRCSPPSPFIDPCLREIADKWHLQFIRGENLDQFVACESALNLILARQALNQRDAGASLGQIRARFDPGGINE